LLGAGLGLGEGVKPLGEGLEALLGLGEGGAEVGVVGDREQAAQLGEALRVGAQRLDESRQVDVVIAHLARQRTVAVAHGRFIARPSCGRRSGLGAGRGRRAAARATPARRAPGAARG
jgi:hypothetical protein